MKARLTLKPGPRGTKSPAKKYGDALLCVRFRYDAELQQRLKTVELIVERTAWAPPANHQENELVPVRIGFNEKDLRNKARAAGGRWNPDVKLWFIPFGRIKGTDLGKHIVLDARGIHAKPKKYIIVDAGIQYYMPVYNIGRHKQTHDYRESTKRMESGPSTGEPVP